MVTSTAASRGRCRAHRSARRRRLKGLAWITSPSRNRCRVVSQFARRAVAIRGGLVQAFHADHVQVARHLAIHRARRHWVLFEHAHQRFHRRAKWRMTRDQVVENSTQGVDVDGRAGLFDVARGLFRGHVAGRAEDLPRHVICSARSVRLARPKSVICGGPLRGSRMLPGFRSRCTTP